MLDENSLFVEASVSVVLLAPGNVATVAFARSSSDKELDEQLLVI